MRRIVILLFVSLLFCQSAYAGEIRSTGPVVIAERPAGEINVVMYMAPW